MEWPNITEKSKNPSVNSKSQQSPKKGTLKGFSKNLGPNVTKFSYMVQKEIF